MIVTTADIRDAARRLGLAGRPLCIHSSLRSFVRLEEGAASILKGLLAEGCTALVPTFTDRFLVPPPPGQRPARNGWDYSSDPGLSEGATLVYTPATAEVDRDMGALPAAVEAMPGRCRGEHALNSFSAVGPLALRLTSKQRPLDVYGPLRELALVDGFVVLMSVGAERMTLIHLAEALAGREPFRRWANGPDGRPMMFQTGGCSEGFISLEPLLASHALEIRVGRSRWRAFSIQSTLRALVAAIQSRPELTRCGDPACRCEDAIRGGPILVAEEVRTGSATILPRSE